MPPPCAGLGKRCARRFIRQIDVEGGPHAGRVVALRAHGPDNEPGDAGKRASKIERIEHVIRPQRARGRAKNTA